MAEIIRFGDDAHKTTQKLLSWYANGTLELGETALVEAHLQACPECREELEVERTLGAMIASAPSDTDRGWAALKARIEGRAEAPKRRPPQRHPASWLGRKVSLGWAVAAQAACLVLFAGGILLAMRELGPNYHALGAPAAHPSGDVMVIFKPSATEEQLRGALRTSGARLVGGPTASDAYVLNVPAAGRSAALARLRADAHVVLAEPIDGASDP